MMMLALATPAQAAVSCSLNDPDRDVRKAFPSSTGYRTEFHSIQAEGGATFRTRFEGLYGRPLDTYSEVDIQHAFYPVLKAKTLIGHMFGATQKGKYGTLQVIAITDTTGAITNVYFQKISAPYAKQLKDKAFTDQFIGLTLADFKGWKTDPKYAGKLSKITSPSPEAAGDVAETLWGLKKVFMLFDHYYKQDAGINAWTASKGA
jgi:hypothetical protein